MNRHHYQLKELEWDTRLFGVKMGELLLEIDQPEFCFNAEKWRSVLEEARRSGYAFLLCQFDTTRQDVCHDFEKSGATLGDVLVRLRLNLDRSDRSANGRAALPVTPADPEDLPELAVIANAGFRNSRFFQDPRFNVARVAEFYPTWIRDSFVKNETYMVVKADERIGGFISFQENIKENDLVIRLIAIHPEMQGRGLGQALMDWIIDYAAEKGLQTITVGTQINNYGALRLYEKNGFRIQSAKYRWHIWL
jgi:ribosomal protein S18 acetylase RimI-like enzyme